MSKLTKFKSIVLVGAFTFAFPIITLAQTGEFAYEGSVFQRVILLIQKIIGGLFPVITAALVLYFAYEVFQFIRSEDEKKAVWKGRILQAVIALAIWFTLFGIITAIANTFDLTVGDTIQTGEIPGVNFPR